MFEDDKFEFEQKRDLCEYIASFWDSKAVSEVRKTREKNQNYSVTEEEFEKQIKEKSYASEDIKNILEAVKHTNLNKDSNNKKKNIKKIMSGNTINKIIRD